MDSEMDTIEFWIWEHATKYGMTKVLRKTQSRYSQIVIPNSWLSALHLRQIKNEWGKLDSKISPKELNALKQSLTSTFKHYIKDLKHVIKISDCIQLDLSCKAAFLVMRSTESKPAVKLQVREKMFPCWNMVLWTKMKDSFGLKDDLIMEKIKKFYLDIRLKLCQVDQEKKIIDQFGDMMKKHFPSLISFMLKIKLSRLERIQLNKMKLDKQYEFLRVRLNGGLGNELVVLDLLEEVQRMKINESALISLKQAKLCEATTDASNKGVILYALPPDPRFENYDQIYPACFLTNPFMSTDIAVGHDGILEELVINRNIPRKPDGKDFGPLWFSDTRLLVLKKEKNGLTIDCDGLKVTENFPVALNTYNASISDHSIQSSSAVADGLAEMKQLSSNAAKETSANLENCYPQLVSKLPPLQTISTIGAERVNSIQSWIDNNPPDSPSSIENGISPLNYENRKEKLPLSSEFIENCALPENCKVSFEKIVRLSEPLVQKFNPPTLEEETDPVANSLKMKTNEWRKSDGVFTEYESSERCIPPSDTEYVSSTTASTSSCSRIQTRTRYKHLTELANRETRREAEKRRLDKDGDASSSSNYRSQRRLHSQSGKPNSECMPVRVTRSKKKCRKLSSSSSSSGYLAASSKILLLEAKAPSVDKVKTSTDSNSEESSTEKQKNRPTERWDGTPPLDEETSNYHTPPRQQDSKCSEDNSSELSALRTGIKRKLCLDEQPVFDSPKSKRVPVENLPDGKRILPGIVETLQKDSEQLRMNDPFFSKHCENLDLCIQRVLRSHVKLSKSDRDKDVPTRVKHGPEEVFLD